MALGARFNNPTLSRTAWRRAAAFGDAESGNARMTVAGTINKTGFLAMMALAVAVAVWPLAGTPIGTPVFAVGMFGGIITALVATFRPNTIRITAPVYALCKGAFLGILTAMFNLRYPGIGIQALGGTMITLFVMLGLYRSGLLRATSLFRKVMMTALPGIFLLLVANLIFRIMGWPGMSFMSVQDQSWLGYIVAVGITVFAALCLILDFDFIERAVETGAPKTMEWYGAFGLLVTLVWIYIRMMLLLARLRNR